MFNDTVNIRIKVALLSLMFILFFGTLGYIIIEGWSFLDSLYMTVITLTTVGYGEVGSLSNQGRIFTISLILFGVGVMAFTIGSLAQKMVEGQVLFILGRRKVEKQIEKLKNHFIICGFGRIGSLIANELEASSVPFVAIDQHKEGIDKIVNAGYLYVMGDATEEETLLKAGIKRARGVVAVLDTNAENLYVTLTARELNRELYIIARAEDESAEKRLTKAGANRAFSPYYLGGMHMAQAILRPNVVDFMEIATQRGRFELKIEEIAVGTNSPLIGKSLKEADIRKNLGVIIVAIKRKTGAMLFNPIPEAEIEKGDILIVLGQIEALEKLQQILL